MTVRLTRPYNGRNVGDFYTGADEDTVVGNGGAISEPGGSFWASESTTHVLSARDQVRDFMFLTPTAVTVRVPKEIDQLPYGIIATYRQGSTGQVSIVGDTGVTVTSTSGFAKTAGQGSVIQVTKTAARAVTVIGALATS